MVQYYLVEGNLCRGGVHLDRKGCIAGERAEERLWAFRGGNTRQLEKTRNGVGNVRSVITGYSKG
jgi:hypothetical protein